MGLHITDYAAWCSTGVAATVLEPANERTYLTVHDVNGEEIKVAPTRVEASYVTSTRERGGWDVGSLTVVGVPKGARFPGETVASTYVGPLAVSGALSRLPEVFRQFVVRNNPSHRGDR